MDFITLMERIQCFLHGRAKIRSIVKLIHNNLYVGLQHVTLHLYRIMKLHFESFLSVETVAARSLRRMMQKSKKFCENLDDCSLSLAHPEPRLNQVEYCPLFPYSEHTSCCVHMMEQLLDLSLLRRSVLLGRCSSLLERRRTGLGLLGGCSLFMQARAAVRKTLWMLFSEVKAEHSR